MLVEKVSVHGIATCSRVSNVKNESMRINSKGMFFGRANLGMQKAMNSLAAAPLSFPAVSIFRIRLCTILQYVTKNAKYYIQQEIAADLREQTYVDTF